MDISPRRISLGDAFITPITNMRIEIPPPEASAGRLQRLELPMPTR